MTQRTRRRQRRRGGIGSKLLLAFGAVFVVAAIAVIAVTSWVLDVAAEAPSLSTCRPVERGGNSTLYAADGSKLGLIASSEARDPVSIDRIPKTLQLATVAIEDQRFYQHGGVDYEGIARAALKDIQAGEAVEGGSTITQQLVRNLCIPNPERNLERKIVEAKLGFVSRKRADAASQRGLGLRVSGGYFEHRQPYFFDYVENRLIERYGVNTARRGGLEVHTTIDPDLQRIGLEAMRSALPYSTDPSSALVSIDPRNGEIRAMVSSSRYGQSQFNLAAQGHRQPGSTFKAFVLTTAIKQGIDPYSTYYTSKPLDLNLPRWGHWEVHTADEGYQGTVNLRQATVSSDNTVFAQLDLDVGPESVAQTAKSMGITTPLDGIPAEGIGGLRLGVSPLELTDAYATLAAGGIHRDPVAITRVVFPSGRVERPERPRPKRVLSEAVAWEVTRLLHDNITEGTGTAAYTGCGGQAGKTGTTDEYTDAWFSGYQPNLATAVWVGYPESNDVSMYSVHGITVFGGTFPAEIWHSLYSEAGIPCEEFTEPAEAISWSPYYGRFARASPAAGGKGGSSGKGGEPPPPGTGAVGGYDPNAYAPGAGQEPAPLPPPPAGGGVGTGETAGGASG